MIDLKKYKDTIQVLVWVAQGAAFVIGGIWVMFKLYMERTYQAALEIGFSANTTTNEDISATFIEVTFRNLGKKMMQVRRTKGQSFVFDDGAEQIQYGADLKVKRLRPSSQSTEVHLDWFTSNSLDDICEVNLLSEYESKFGVEFWMEPGETYHLGVPLKLNSGIYLAKITFVGADNDFDFWSRIVEFEVGQAGVSPSS